MSHSSNEKRCYRRVSFISNIYVSLDGHTAEFNLLDISLKGLMLERIGNFFIHKGQIYALSLKLSDKFSINMQAKLMHSSEQIYGMQWIAIDLDSFTSLRRLLELNGNAPEEIYRELSELVALK